MRYPALFLLTLWLSGLVGGILIALQVPFDAPHVIAMALACGVLFACWLKAELDAQAARRRANPKSWRDVA